MDEGHDWEIRTEKVSPMAQLGWAAVYATRGKVFTVMDGLRDCSSTPCPL
jgi:hypothetical protein